MNPVVGCEELDDRFDSKMLQAPQILLETNPCAKPRFQCDCSARIRKTLARLMPRAALMSLADFPSARSRSTSAVLRRGDRTSVVALYAARHRPTVA